MGYSNNTWHSIGGHKVSHDFFASSNSDFNTSGSKKLCKKKLKKAFTNLLISQFKSI